VSCPFKFFKTVVGRAILPAAARPARKRVCSLDRLPHSRRLSIINRDSALEVQLIDILLVDYERRTENDFAAPHFQSA
jgi:hypothetical protein